MTETNKDEARRSLWFAHGVCSALAVLAQADQESYWREIVRDNGGYDYLHGVSKRAGNLRTDGFVRYRKEAR